MDRVEPWSSREYRAGDQTSNLPPLTDISTYSCTFFVTVKFSLLCPLGKKCSSCTG